MTSTEQKQKFEDFTNKMKSLLLSKGDDYAGQSDRLQNFKDAGTIAGTSAEANCFNLMATKMARLKQLLTSSSKPNNESVDDSLLDLANYAFLLTCIRNEKSASDKPLLYQHCSRCTCFPDEPCFCPEGLPKTHKATF